MGPRPIGRGNSRPSPPPRLSASLQWGRDRSVAEIPPDPARTNPHKLLQWGRDRSVAEILGNSWGWTVDFRGFNGAATDRSRKLRYRNTRAKLVCFASMGPRPIGRGNLVGIGDHHDLLLASMGPRPIGRGNWPSESDTHAPAPPLQWGRDRSVAEIRSFLVKRRCWAFLLQWGRDRSVAEMRLHGNDKAGVCVLQWGGDRSVAEIRAASSIATSSV